MKITKILILTFTAIFIFILTSCNSSKSQMNNIILTIDNSYEVTEKEFNKYITDWFYHKKFSDTEEMYDNALNDLLINQLKRIDFFEIGLDKDPRILNYINKIINEELVVDYFMQEYMGKYLNDDFAQEIYKIMDKEVKYRAIYLKKPIKESQDTLDALREKAIKIKTDIESGADFISLVKKYSENEISLANNGIMPTASWKQRLIDPVADAISNLKNKDIQILNTMEHFIVVEILDINKKEIESFETLKEEIMDEIKKVYMTIADDEFVADKENQIIDEKVIWNKEGFNQYFKWANERNFFSDEYQKYHSIIENALQNGNNKVIFTYNDIVVDYKEVLRLMNDVLLMDKSDNKSEKNVKSYLLESLKTDLIIKKAEALDLKKDIFHANTTNPSLKTQMARVYNESEIDWKIPEPTDKILENFFKENETTIYYQLAKVNLFVMVFDSEAEANEANEKIKNGTPFEKVTGSYLVKTLIKDRDGEIKTLFTNKKDPVLSEIAFELKKSEIAGPIKITDDNNQQKYAIVKSYENRPEKQLTYAEASKTIVDDFENYTRKKLEKEVEERLKAKYNYEINEKLLQKLKAQN